VGSLGVTPDFHHGLLVRFDLRERGIQALVIDIEGTTTPVAFVYDVLFPFARRELRSYLRENLDGLHLREPLRQLREEWLQDQTRGAAPPSWSENDRGLRVFSVASYAEWLMDRDRKSPGLKALQGLIWERGYRDGTLRGVVFPDVPAAFTRWHAAAKTIAIFSSGSVLAQQMLFRTTTLGDLTPCIDGFFDTVVGPKTSPDSYRRIADALRCTAGQVLFISDTTQELEAARDAGWAVVMCVRPGHRPPPGPEWATISDFGEIEG
jgi:enolase-phosphatase E1